MQQLKKALATIAVGAATIGAMALPTFADTGGVPNENACFGQAIMGDAPPSPSPASQGELVSEGAQNELEPGWAAEVLAFDGDCSGEPSPEPSPGPSPD
ncbi:MAG: hypothetical protein WEA04_03940 [Candidatus Andersenbacteria bacterium]